MLSEGDIECTRYLRAAIDSLGRAECTQCFDSHDLAAGIDVCLTCFNGACPPEINGVASTNAHGRLHYEKTGHAVVVNVRRRRKPEAEIRKSKRVSPRLSVVPYALPSRL